MFVSCLVIRFQLSDICFFIQQWRWICSLVNGIVIWKIPLFCPIFLFCTCGNFLLENKVSQFKCRFSQVFLKMSFAKYQKFTRLKHFIWGYQQNNRRMRGSNTLTSPDLKIIISSTNKFAVNWKALKHLEFHDNKRKKSGFSKQLRQNEPQWMLRNSITELLYSLFVKGNVCLVDSR